MHAGLRASNLCVSRLLFLHPTQAVFNGKDQKFVTTILAIGWRSSSALLPAKRSGASCVWSSPFFNEKLKQDLIDAKAGCTSCCVLS